MMTGVPAAASDAPAGNGDDLFGTSPDHDPLAAYCPPDPSADIFAGAGAQAGAVWHAFARGLQRQCRGKLSALQSDLDGHVEDLGLAFRMTGDMQERAWPLSPMPIFIDAAEWETITAGLIQRAELLEQVIADIYGPQELVRAGHLPAAVISGSANFARRLTGIRPAGGYFLNVYAVDLARGPTGEWRVLADRVKFPVGIGYALQNRQALARATGGLLARVGVRQQTGFFDALRQGMAAISQRPEPRIGLLTPGRFNQSYPEQAHLARHLGFSLVEGRDLMVRDGKLFVRTISGLKRMDALWRWIVTRDIDPLSFDARSRIGVSGLISAASKGLVLANWPGGGVVESRAMPAFLPRLAGHLLGEDLALPNAATWWCGGRSERDHVERNLASLVISSAFRRPITGLGDGHTRAGASLSPEERATILEGMARRPMDYTAQEIVRLSTTPVLADGHFEARGFTVRAFLARDENGQWIALQGGFARVSSSGELRTSLMGLGDISSDLCIVDRTAPVAPEVIATPAIHDIRREHGLLSSQAADNLFWLGRYGERSAHGARIIRILLDRLATEGQGPDTGKGEDAGAGASTTITRLAGLLRRLGAAPDASPQGGPVALAATALGSTDHAGSCAALADREWKIAQLLRDRLSQDAWRVLQPSLPAYDPGDTETMLAACNQLIEKRAALASLLAEGMSRGPAWRFWEMGMRIERASMLLQTAQALVPGQASALDLSALLDLIDGQSAYRSRYIAMPYIAPVFDMVLLDPAQPRGLAHQIIRIEDHLAALPPLRDTGMPEEPLKRARELRANVEALDPAAIGVIDMDDLRNRLDALSEAISARYFLQADEPSGTGRSRLA